MVSLDEAVIARYEREGMHFEILIDPKAAEEFVDGKDITVTKHLAADHIFKDANKGTKASDEALTEVFETTDLEHVAEYILKHGDIQLTTAQRRAMRERKYNKLIDIIARNSMNPQTNMPHPKDRIERALEEASFHVDAFTPIDEQVKNAIDAIRPIIPISTENVEVEVKIPPKYAGKAYGQVKSIGTMRHEEWLSDGSFKCRIELPAGMQSELYDKLNSVTKGEVETRLIK